MSRSIWSPTTLAVVDTEYDQDYASDGRSRFGAYVGQHSDQLRDFDGEPAQAPYFATGAWRIATVLMDPGYVRVRADLAGITVSVADGEPDLLVATVTVPLSHAHLTAGRLLRSGTWSDWVRDQWTGSAPYHLHAEPDDHRRALLAQAAVRVPIRVADLPTPTHTCSTGRVTDAIAIVQALTDQVNQLAGQQVADLTGRTLQHV